MANNTHHASGKAKSSGQHLSRWARRWRLERKLAFALSVAAIAFGIATYWTISRSESPFGPDPQNVMALILGNLLLLLMLVALVSRRATGLWLALRRGSVGSRLQTRIVTTFSLITIVPTVIVSVFSAIFFNYGIQAWFNERISIALEESVAVAEAYLNEHKEIIRADALAMATDIDNEMRHIVGNTSRFNTLVNSQTALRSLSEAVVIQRNRIIAQSRFSFALTFEPLEMEALERANKGDVVIYLKEEKIRALVKLHSLPDTYLLVGRLVDQRVLAHMAKAKGAVAEYRRLKRDVSGLQIKFSFVFMLVALILLLAAIWYGMMFAARLVIPITRLVKAAERVRGGDYSAHVDEGDSDDEIAALGRAFNRMTSDLSHQRDDLIEANRQLDARRRFSEAVLAGVSAGVIALDQYKNITLYNRTAAKLLGLKETEQLYNRAVGDILPQLVSMLEEAEEKPEKRIQQEINISHGSTIRTLLVRITTERFGDKIEGFIITFDDITELVMAQRSAAWSDVARRVAHEIKNPLTPIHLAAERLKRKYSSQIEGEDRDTYLKYVDTISRHVGDIGRMVEEFVSFARMPAPVFKRQDLTALLKKAVFSEQVVHQDITYKLMVPEQPIWINCDEQQMSRVFTNLLKNAAEAIASRRDDSANTLGIIVVSVMQEGKSCIVAIEDNGPGFPEEMMDRILEPYITTREKGTGLGLAIVKKIVEDHKGSITVTNLSETGARVTLSFSTDSDINAS